MVKKLYGICLAAALLLAAPVVLDACGAAAEEPAAASETADAAKIAETAEETEGETVMKTWKVACLGDSITNLGGDDKTYVDFLGDDTLPVAAQNVGMSGSSLGIPGVDGANPALCQRWREIEKDADVILIFGGSNDYGHSEFPCTLGDPSADTDDRMDFCSALRYLIVTLRQKYPSAAVIYVMPLTRNEEKWYRKLGLPVEDATGVNRFGYTLDDYRKAASEICARYDCPVLDAHGLPELDPYAEETASVYFRDGVHLTDEGARFLAAFLTKGIAEIVG